MLQFIKIYGVNESNDCVMVHLYNYNYASTNTEPTETAKFAQSRPSPYVRGQLRLHGLPENHKESVVQGMLEDDKLFQCVLDVLTSINLAHRNTR